MCVIRLGSGEKSPYPAMARCGHIRAIRSYAYGPVLTSQNVIFNHLSPYPSDHTHRKNGRKVKGQQMKKRTLLIQMDEITDSFE